MLYVLLLFCLQPGPRTFGPLAWGSALPPRARTCCPGCLCFSAPPPPKAHPGCRAPRFPAGNVQGAHRRGCPGCRGPWRSLRRPHRSPGAAPTQSPVSLAPTFPSSNAYLLSTPPPAARVPPEPSRVLRLPARVAVSASRVYGWGARVPRSLARVSSGPARVTLPRSRVTWLRESRRPGCPELAEEACSPGLPSRVPRLAARVSEEGAASVPPTPGRAGSGQGDLGSRDQSLRS